MGDINIKELELIIRNYLGSENLKTMMIADKYYTSQHDILNRIRKAIGKNGELVPVKNLPNNKIIDNMFTGAVDQKTNYLLSKNLTLTSQNKRFIDELNKIFNSNFLKLLHSLGKDAYKYGIAFLYVFYNEDGELSFKKFNAKEIIPIWKDESHEELDYCIRLYKTKKFTGIDYKEITNVEIYTLNGIDFYSWDNGLIKVKESINHMQVENKGYNWEHLPIIPFKANELEIPLIARVKSIQDAINEITSDFKNDMEENARTTILIIKNFAGEGDTLRHNINTYGYIPVRDNGGVEPLNIEVNASNYESILKLLKKAFIENAKAFDAKNDKIQGSNVNQMNIQSMYSDIDLDASALEREFKKSLNELVWFIKQSLNNFQDEEVEIVFNKDIMMNESQVIADCKASVGIISQETIVSQHPWVTDIEVELKRIEKENKELDPYPGDFGTKKVPDLNE